MTAVAAYNDGSRIWIASDGVASIDQMIFEYGSKLVRRGNYVFGFAGNCRMADVLKETRCLPDEISGIKGVRLFRDAMSEAAQASEADGDIDILIICPSGIFTIGSDLDISRVRKYHAIGTGDAYAFGVLYAASRARANAGKSVVRTAVQAACRFNALCGGQCYTASVAKKNKKNN